MINRRSFVKILGGLSFLGFLDVFSAKNNKPFGVDSKIISRSGRVTAIDIEFKIFQQINIFKRHGLKPKYIEINHSAYKILKRDLTGFYFGTKFNGLNIVSMNNDENIPRIGIRC